MREMLNCKVCEKENPKHIFYCEEHYYCADCGTKEKLCTYTEDVLCYPCHDKRVEQRIAEFTGDTSYTNEAICPYCGYEQGDSWEKSEGESTCGDCERTFVMVRNTTVDYSTHKKE